ncbi:unnamed protein product [Tilletia laevis]|nr:unnamed protein product [Tilletia laevis]
MASPPGNGSFAKTSKYCTHLALSADLILGDATSTMSVHEIACTMDDEAGQIHNVTLNCWSREQPLQGLYIVYHVPFATHPNRLGVSDPTTMRRLPDEFDGPAPVALMQTLDINVPANNDRAERLRQARAANRLAMEQKKNGVPAEPTATTSTVPTASTATTSSTDPPTESPTGPPSTPTTSGIRKRGRAD